MSRPDAGAAATTAAPPTLGRRPLRLGPAERRLLLKAADLTGAGAAWWLALRPAVLASPSAGAAAASLAALALLWLLAAEGAEAYPPEAHRRGREAAPALLPGPALVAGGLLLLLHAAVAWTGPFAPPDGSAALGFLAGLLLAPAALRLLLRPLLAREDLRPRLLVAGRDAGARALARTVRERGAALYTLVGLAGAGDGEGADAAATADHAGPVPLPTVGSLSDLGRLVEARGIDVVALARPSEAVAAAGDALTACVEAGVKVAPLAELVERLTGRVPLEHLEDGVAGALPLDPPATRPAHRAAKRALDLALVAVGLVFFLPVVPLIAAAIRLETPGPVFYTQARVGRGGRVFRMYKFRSMVADAEAEGAPRWATEDDPRITRVGRILRGMHLDEFPQMLNILKGEMSPVGPRPERPEFVERLEGEIPHYRMRHAVRPGMAGWALVEHGYASSMEEARQKHEYDLYYVKHQSVWLDLVVLARTLVDSFSLGGR